MKVDRILQAGILAMLCAFVGVLYLSLHDNVVKAGDKAPDFSITADNGRTVTARQFGGKLLILNFWAALCAGSPIARSAAARARAEGPRGPRRE
jgi:hypothetical protein